eukprot:scaffold10096_cov29-Attheya_sp.AAC.2
MMKAETIQSTTVPQADHYYQDMTEQAPLYGGNLLLLFLPSKLFSGSFGDDDLHPIHGVADSLSNDGGVHYYFLMGIRWGVSFLLY